MKFDVNNARFPLGDLVATPAALQAVPAERVIACLGRHMTGDWGDVDAGDRAENDAALASGERLVSAYPIQEGQPEEFLIITEADRSVTTVLLPDDY